MNDLLSIFQSSWKEPFNGSIIEWAKHNVILPASEPVPGPFSTADSQYMDRVFESFQNPLIRQTNFRKGTQIGGSKLLEICLMYKILTDKGDILHLLETSKRCKKYSANRLKRLFLNHPAILDLLPQIEKHAFKNCNINFNAFNYTLEGAEVGSNSETIKTLFGDELWLWEENGGNIDQIKKRIEWFQSTSKILFVSSAGKKNDQWDREWNKGKGYEYGWSCPECKWDQIFKFELKREDGSYAGVSWKVDGQKIPRTKEGIHDYEACSKAAHFECFHCRTKIPPTVSNRRLMDKGLYILTKPNGSADIESFQTPTLASIKVTLGKLVREYLEAKDVMNFTKEPFRVFYQTRLAEPWEENKIYNPVSAAVKTFDPNEPWGNRVMAIDVQKDGFYWVVVAFGNFGTIRILAIGKALSYDELRTIQQKWQVPMQMVGIDINSNKTEIASAISEHGDWVNNDQGQYFQSWMGLVGSKRNAFDHYDTETKSSTEKMYAPVKLVDYMSGKAITNDIKEVFYYEFSVRRTKDILSNIRDGKAGSLTLSSDISDELVVEFNNSMNSEALGAGDKNPEIYWPLNDSNPQNHFWDCMNYALIIGILSETFTVKVST